MQASKTALVTGASRGMGKEIALELARHGYKVAVNYYNDPAPVVDETMAEIRGLQADAFRFKPTSVPVARLQ
jgi:Dehydrogenases with different specificities (related to short-chain alcohol dehydrogenases)